MLKVVRFFCLILLFSPLVYLGYKAIFPSIMEVKLWNGNKTMARQDYERTVLKAAMDVTREQYGDWQLVEDVRDLTTAEDEAGVFRTQRFDVFGTVAGNPKLDAEQKHVVPIPIMNGLLGYRVVIIRAEEQADYSAIKAAESLQQLRVGIPATWADAGLFRHNGYRVDDGGSFDELFARHKAGEFDYVSFGANEVESVFSERAAPLADLAIENSLLLYYPYPVVFYVNPTKTQLAERLALGLQRLGESGELERLFNQFYGDLVARLRLRERHLITLENPLLPAELKDFQSTLLSKRK